ncbi:hypothetical protein ACHAQI_000009 [Fusarium lateritium]
MVATDDQISFFKKNGYLITRDLLANVDQEVDDKDETVLCRTENFADCHSGFSNLIRSPKLLDLLNDLAEDSMFLFKARRRSITNSLGAVSNLPIDTCQSLAGTDNFPGGFAPHIDAVAYTHIKGVKHLTILLSVDPSNIRNGGLEVVDGSHEIDVPINKATNCIASTWVDSQTWTPVELETGELLIFTAYLAHRSGANTTSSDRKAIYATYNRDCEGDLRHGTTSTESRSGQLHICVDVWLWISYA